MEIHSCLTWTSAVILKDKQKQALQQCMEENRKIKMEMELLEEQKMQASPGRLLK